MKISELILQLKTYQEKYGDLEIITEDEDCNRVGIAEIEILTCLYYKNIKAIERYIKTDNDEIIAEQNKDRIYLYLGVIS